ncbi:hypothetical protein [Haloactinopolyspora sp.]|uniref:hypothetical protein n=1 Tax=Haloactinopolyspora sp. TaxID=1966353 RepID=UPI00260BC23C|nr:hypothetical protein [Haloactinopolyspora sp.]
MAKKAEIVIAEMRNLVTGVENGIENLTEAKSALTSALDRFNIDHTLGANVQKAIDWGETELPGVRRRLSLAEALEGSEPEWEPGTAKIDESQISDVPPGEAERNGEEAALALLDSPGEITPELAAEIEENMNDPYFAAGFAKNADPEQLAAALDTLDAFVEATEIPMELRNRMVEAVGATIGTATRNVGDLAMPDDYQQQWTSAITADSYDQGGDAPQNQAQYLALLMQQGTYDRQFLNYVGATIYDYETSGDGPVWGPKSNHMDPVLDTNGEKVIDVMAAYMGALENNPLAAQDFFSRGGTVEVDVEGEKVQMNERLAYMIQDRTWDSFADPSNGGQFGAALEAATTYFRNDEETGRISAEIASQTFALIGDRTGDDASGGFLGIGASDGWQMWRGMRENVANIMASYGPDMLRIARTEQSDGIGPPWTVGPETEILGDGAPYGAAMDPELVQQILGTYGKDGQDEYLNIVLAGVGAASQWRMGTALEGALDDGTPPPAPVAILQGQNVPQLTTATNEMAAAFGWVINGAYHGALDEEELEEKQAELRSQVFGAMTSIPGVAPAGKWSEFAFDQITSQIEDKIGETDPDASGQFSELSANEKEQLEQMILNQMLANGYFDEEYIDEANGGEGGTRYEGPPDDAIVPGSDPPQFDFDSPAYNEWLRTKFPMDDFLNSNVYPPFNEHLEAGLDLAGG